MSPEHTSTKFPNLAENSPISSNSPHLGLASITRRWIKVAELSNALRNIALVAKPKQQTRVGQKAVATGDARARARTHSSSQC